MNQTGPEPDQSDVTLTGPDGLRLTVPDFYRELPDRETAQVPIVAAVTGGGEDPGAFTPTIAVQVDLPTPELATIQGLSQATVARQISLSRHVVSVDIWSVPGQPDGRRVESIYPEGDETILELQYLAVRAGRCLTLSVLVLASAHGFGLELFSYVAGTLRCEAPGAQLTPLSEPAGPTDPPAQITGASLESLADIGSRQAFLSSGPRLEAEDIKALRASRRRSRLGREALVSGGLVDPRGELTDAGSPARDLLAKARAQLLAQVVVPGTQGRYVLEGLLGASEVAVLADPPPGWVGTGAAPAVGGGLGKSLDVIPALTLPITLIRWLGLAPAWNVDPAAPPDREVTIARALWQARLADPRASPPRGGSASFLHMWEQPWALATVSTTKRWRNGPGSLQYLSTPEAGYLLVIPDAHGRWVRLESRPSAQLLHALLVVAGVVDRREPQ